MIKIWQSLLTLFFPITCIYTAPIQEQVLICGVCRNVETRLEKTKQIMESIGNLFEDYRILVYENNSTDNSPQILLSWAKENPKVWIKLEHLSQSDCAQNFINTYVDGSFFIPEQISRARNIVLEEAMSDLYHSFPYLIWMDMDFVLSPDLEGFIDTFHSDRDWDAVFAYGIDPQKSFWDWYAFRDHNYPLGSELLGMHWWYMPKHISLSPEDDWYPVYSAFGGCGIYKKSSIEGCAYSALVTPDLETYAKKLIDENLQQNHPQILDYIHFCEHLESLYKIEYPHPQLLPIFNPNAGILLQTGPEALIWRLSSFVYQYPSVCEHVPLHASMAVRGHGKFYINPKLVFRYGD